MIDRDAPPYVYIWRDLRSQIEGGVYKPGDKLPSEKSLTKKYGHSRLTIRRALQKLADEGFIIAEQGRGTFVISRKPISQRRLGNLPSFTQQLKGSGFNPESRLLCKEFIPAGKVEKWIAEAFHVKEGENLVHIRRLRLGDGEPLAIQSVYLLPALCPDILEKDFSSLFQLYEEHYGVYILEAEEVFQISWPSDEEASLLKLTSGTPVMVRRRISIDQRGRVFEALRSVDRNDSFEYHYHIIADETRMMLRAGERE